MVENCYSNMEGKKAIMETLKHLFGEFLFVLFAFKEFFQHETFKDKS